MILPIFPQHLKLSLPHLTSSYSLLVPILENSPQKQLEFTNGFPYETWLWVKILYPWCTIINLLSLWFCCLLSPPKLILNFLTHSHMAKTQLSRYRGLCFTPPPPTTSSPGESGRAPASLLPPSLPFPLLSSAFPMLTRRPKQGLHLGKNKVMTSDISDVGL